jgi:hypothetical protein
MKPIVYSVRSTMTAAIQHYEMLRDREKTSNRIAVLTQAAENDFKKDELPIIPAGTQLVLDFAGDFGCYAIADVSGILHKVKIELKDIHKICLSDSYILE